MYIHLCNMHTLYTHRYALYKHYQSLIIYLAGCYDEMTADHRRVHRSCAGASSARRPGWCQPAVDCYCWVGRRCYRDRSLGTSRTAIAKSPPLESAGYAIVQPTAMATNRRLHFRVSGCTRRPFECAHEYIIMNCS